MKILMVSSEAVPFAKTGGLADAVPALATALHALGHDVRIVIPRYYDIDRSLLNHLPDPLGVPMGNGELWCGIYRGTLPGTMVPVYFLDREDLYGRKGLYGPDGSSSWPDNARRFAFLASAAFQLCRARHWIPDILHLHDWQAAPAAWMLARRERTRGFEETRSILTVHNLGYQGVFSATEIGVFAEEFVAQTTDEGFYHGDLNFLAAGLEHADALTTVSPTYAEEILSTAYGEGLDELIAKRSQSLTGIINGMDYEGWNPADDPALAPDNFDTEKPMAKARVKERLQAEMGLPVNADLPLIGMVTRLTGQKGVDLLCCLESPALKLFKEGSAQLVVLGTGETRYEKAFKKAAAAYPKSIAVKIAFSGPMSRLIEGGADFFLMPSRYEPCGLNQMYSLRYGTLPIVRKTGGLADTVKDLGAHKKKGNGFVFKQADESSLAEVIERAVAFYSDRKALNAARKRAMGLRFDWQSSAKKYLQVYKRAFRS